MKFMSLAKKVKIFINVIHFKGTIINIKNLLIRIINKSCFEIIITQEYKEHCYNKYQKN